jgi:hypothetical protein
MLVSANPKVARQEVLYIQLIIFRARGSKLRGLIGTVNLTSTIKANHQLGLEQTILVNA